MTNELRYGKEAYCTYSFQLHCTWLNEISAGCLIFINNLHVHSASFYIGEELSHFYFIYVLCAIYPSRNRTTLFILWYMI